MKLQNRLFFFPFIILSTLLILKVQAIDHCASSCAFSLTTASSGACSAVDSETACTFCDNTIYYMNGSTCVLLPNGRLNDSVVKFPTNDWTITDPPNSQTNFFLGSITSGWTYLHTSYANNAVVNWTSSSLARYGFQCRVLLYTTTSLVSNSRFIVHGTTNSTNDIRVPANAFPDYNNNYFIYTSPFITNSDKFVRLNINKDASGHILWKDFRCMEAKCVQNCLSCTSLTTCTLCNTNFNLDKNKYCVDATKGCPPGQFFNATDIYCGNCDPKCIICTTNSVTCSLCSTSGQNEAFLFTNNTCLSTCPVNYTHNSTTHKCDCPTENFYTLTVAAPIFQQCKSCHVGCKICTGPLISACTLCNLGYYLYKPDGLTICNVTCPLGQYASELELAICILCDTTKCLQCINQSSICTVCYPNTQVWLFNSNCTQQCPHGYEANNSTFECDRCMLGKFSYLSKCVSECPPYYEKDLVSKACMIANGGYPINLIFEVENDRTLKFTIDLDLGLQATMLTRLNSTWNTFIELSFWTSNSSKFVTTPLRLLQTFGTFIPISNAIISNSSILLFTTSISAIAFKNTHQFSARFADNLVSSNNVIYAISSSNSTDSAPWVIRQYFELNKKPFYLISIIFFIAALIPLLMRIKNGYQILIEYYQCIQLSGLCLFSLYPYIGSIDIYSFVSGLEFSNFSFMFNVPVQYIPVCVQCRSLSSYSFVVGDMNWLKIIGSLLPCIFILLVIILITFIFVISRQYALFLIKLTVDLIIIKCIHAWFGSLIYAGLNLLHGQGNGDVYISLMHLLSYLLLIPLLYVKFQNAQKDFYPVSCQFFMLFYVMLVTIISVGPLLICSILMFVVCIEWCYHVFSKNLFNQGQKQRIIYGEGYGEERREGEKVFIVDGETLDANKCWEFLPDFYFYFLRSIRPITAFVIACIMMIDLEAVTISLVSVIFGACFIVILVLIYLMHGSEKETVKILPKLTMMSSQANDIKEYANTANESDNDIGRAVNFDTISDNDQGVVGDKFHCKQFSDIVVIPNRRKRSQLNFGD